MKRRVITISTTVLFAATVMSAGFLSTGCELLTQVLGLIGLELLGITPSSNFGSTGNIDFSLMGQGEDNQVDLSSLAAAGLNVRVRNDDGSLSDCDFVDEDTIVGSDYNTLAILIDDSGSMENYYPEAEYGDMCLSCPHDPNRMRAEAALKLIDAVLEEAPTSRIALMDFGPEADAGMDATRVLADFGSTRDSLRQAIGMIDGSQMVGTPMWDSLVEIIGQTSEEADDYHEELMSLNPRETTRPPAEDPEEPPVDEPTTDVVDPTEIRVQRFIVVLGDGDDAAEYGGSDDYTLDDVIRLAQQENVVIHAIGLGTAAATNDNPLVKQDEMITTVTNLQRLAEETGGYYASASSPEALLEMYQNIALSMTEGYTVDTFSCQPREEGSDRTGRIPDSGEPVDGTVEFGQFALPWTIIAP